MPTARISDSTTSEIQTIAPVFDSFTQPHETISQISAPNSASSSTMPNGPIEVSVARRNTNQPISSTMPSTASSGVIAGKPVCSMCANE
jgi:hypothetical protein